MVYKDPQRNEGRSNNKASCSKSEVVLSRMIIILTIVGIILFIPGFSPLAGVCFAAATQCAVIMVIQRIFGKDHE